MKNAKFIEMTSFPMTTSPKHRKRTQKNLVTFNNCRNQHKSEQKLTKELKKKILREYKKGS